jgi:hypothetical protein
MNRPEGGAGVAGRNAPPRHEIDLPEKFETFKEWKSKFVSGMNSL